MAMTYTSLARYTGVCPKGLAQKGCYLEGEEERGIEGEREGAEPG